jgi:hypothetical protein
MKYSWSFVMQRRMFILRTLAILFAIILTFALVPHRSQADSPMASGAPGKGPALVWTDIDGRGYGPVQLKTNAATVFIFFSTQCPVSNAYMGRVRELEQTYFGRRVRFFLVNDYAPDSPDAMRRYVQDRHVVSPLVKDVDHALVERLGVRVTSEAVVLDRNGLVRYRGAIDDNNDASLAQQPYLARALDAVLAGQPVALPWHKAEGCFIDIVKPIVRKGIAGVTYAHDVAPILNRECVGCHRSGEVAPFSLLTYADARLWARQIKDVTQRHIMPPWKAEPGHGDFSTAPAMTATERATLARWAESGMPAGNLTAAPRPPAAIGEWPLGKPDLIVRPNGSYHLAAEGRDVYRCFVLPVEIKQDTYINFSQIRPGNRSIVHHIIVYADPTGKCAKMAGNDPQASFDNPRAGAGGPVAEAPGIAGWAPGNFPECSPAGVAMFVPKGAQLVMEVHYHRSGRSEADQSEIGLTFARGAITKRWDGGMVVQPLLVLAPGNPHISVSGETTLAEDVTLYDVVPHMHQIGKEMHVWATTPDKKQIELIWLKDWDFNWQLNYVYRQPIKLPQGTHVSMMAIFDNSESNPRNPNRPAKQITWGEQSTDEMCIAFLDWTQDAEHLSLQAPDWQQCVQLLPSASSTATAAVAR